MMGYLGALRVQQVIGEQLEPAQVEAEAALAEAASNETKPWPLGRLLPLASPTAQCSAADRSHINASVIHAMTTKGFKLPTECPTPEDPAKILRMNGHVEVCLQKFLGITPRCAQCHQAFISKLPSCLPMCAGMVFACPTQKPGSEIPKACFAKVGECARCTAPVTMQNFKCTGDLPKEFVRLFEEFAADVVDGSLQNKAKATAFFNKVSKAIR